MGTETAHNVVLKDILDDGVTFESASDNGVYDSSTRTVTWDIGSVNSTDHGYRTLNVSIPQNVLTGSLIFNDAKINTSDPEIRYDDNEALAKTKVIGLLLPLNVGVEPSHGGLAIPSVYYAEPITFSYHNTGLPVTGVNINIHFDDGSDITDTMTNVTNNMSDWTYTTTLYPSHGKATVTYTKQFDPNPYTPSYDIRGDYGDFVSADDIYNYIKNEYPRSPMLSEPDIGSKFKNAAITYGIDPVCLVSFAETASHFGTIGWGADHPEAHNAFLYGVYDNNTTVNQINSASSWGDMVTRVACAIATGPNYFTKGRYTIEEIYNASFVDQGTQNLNTVSSSEEAPYHGVFGDYLLGIIPASQLAGYFIPGLDRLHEALLALEIAADNYYGNKFTEKVEHEVVYNLEPSYLAYRITFLIYVDPAGYIYDVDTGQRIANASVWLQSPDGSGGWKNVSTGENPPVAEPDTNPLISDQDGGYQWDTLPGSYRVHVEAPGYESNDSIVVSVPPPVTDLHVGLHRIYDPNVPPVLPVANFSTDVSSGYAPLSVQFTDLSENATGRIWDFGDETSSYDRYPIHTYTAPGIYTVNLTASNGNGVNSKTDTINVQAVPIYPVANFSSNISEGYAPLSVQFTDLSENGNGTRNWDFGDGDNSTDQSPMHTYTIAGNYIVTLTVSNENGTDSSFARINVSSQSPKSVPEFPTIAVPVISLIGLIFMVMRRRDEK